MYEAQDPKGNSGNRTFSKLLGKYGNRDEFFVKFGQDSGKPVSESSKTEINNACENKANKKNINGKVYLWWGKVKDKNTWIYALDLHNHDWDSDPKVEKEFSSTIPTIRA
ncbi:hypothetical protein MHF_0571 [Mycoplasma haemofelis Ohio2]|uniref:Uncharacterized protein n=1 Tax=Mycoplasma haemofelis (strain Ohio2) TaxID=859194 RepID=F6FHZ5_MYCHI|nr:hypothetical protein MHF_0571 [Mycoplasma haemofelis Ohio2]